MKKCENKNVNKKAFKFDYANIGIDHLLIYCANNIVERGDECTFETLVHECFSLFPKKFSLVNYPHWPDSSRVDKSWRRCRTDKGWLCGTAREGLRVTEAGREVAYITEKKLFKTNETRLNNNLNSRKTKEEAIINYIIETKEFKRYLMNGPYDISERELRSFLGGTLETPKRVLIHNFHIYHQIAKKLKNREILSFLKLCSLKIKKLGGSDDHW